MRKKLLGYGIDTFTFNEAVEAAINLIKKNEGASVVTINPEMIENADKNPEFENILNNSELVIPDGAGIQLGLRINGVKVQKIPGIEFAHSLLFECEKNGFEVALLGAKKEVIELAAKNLKQEMPNLKIVYVNDGYFKDENKIKEEIKNSGAKVLLCALGSPKQEFFIDSIKREFKLLGIGVGGSFDVWSGQVKRAPEIWQKLNLEWLYRTVCDPSRFKRIFPTLPKFLFRVIILK